MLDPERLRAVQTIVCHRNPDSPCPDGVASAIILRDVLPDAEVHFVSHGAELRALEPMPGMLFCDIAPAAERADDFIAQGTIVLDHHVTAKPVVDRFGPLGVYADAQFQPGVSGAMLAFREVWQPLSFSNAQRPWTHIYPGRAEIQIRDFAALAGIRDTWLRNNPLWRQACAQAEALTFWSWKDIPRTAFDRDGYSPSFRQLLDLGPVLLRKREARTKCLIKSGLPILTARGTRVLILPSRETSDVAEELGSKFDLVIGFGYHAAEGHPYLSVSTRSHTSFDCAAFCQAYGGGGHARAAGFELPVDADNAQPFAFLESMLDVWEASRG